MGVVDFVLTSGLGFEFDMCWAELTFNNLVSVFEVVAVLVQVELGCEFTSGFKLLDKLKQSNKSYMKIYITKLKL